MCLVDDTNTLSCECSEDSEVILQKNENIA